jgi:phosphatidylethanolamine-binding protein (PEBP) family uncharacterized protein
MKIAIVFGILVVVIPAAGNDRVSFNRDVRPILAEHCWQCHGPDDEARQSGLRLDVREPAMQPAESGTTAIAPHDPEQSELVRRITANDESTRMPPASFDKPLSADQIESLRNWILQGAEFQRHWAFRQLAFPDVPRRTEGMFNPIDAFVESKLKQYGQTFAPQTSREKLLRRVSFALTGLPPTLGDLDRVDESYGGAVDRLLASPHFGERMAVDWLDAARYADTNGYFGDKPRQMWLWRDWVIDAFNSNMPYDQFTIEQLAGDLLPGATVRQRVATGFNRNHMANDETGIIDEEYRTEYVVDRVDTTMTTWMAITAGCAQCHDHKYDPVSQREFYRLFAFFNNVPETGLITADDPPPLISVTTPRQERRLVALAAAAADAKSAFERMRQQLDAEMSEWESAAALTLPAPPAESVVVYEPFDGQLDELGRPIGTAIAFQRGVHGQAGRFDATQHAERTAADFALDAPWSIGFWMKPNGALSCLLSKIEPTGKRRGFEVLLQKGRVGVNLVDHWGVRAIEISTRKPVAARQWHHVVVAYDGSQNAQGLRVLIDGTRRELVVRRNTLTHGIVNDEVLRIGRRDSGLGYYGLLDELRIVQRSLTDERIADWFRGERIRGILETGTESRSERDHEFLLDDYVERHADSEVRAARQHMKQTQQAEQEFRATIPTTLVMQELPERRPTRVLTRGQYDQPGDAVQPGVPAAISAMPADAPRTRLGFAHWLVADDNPLTARVAVNRLWKQCFGEGLVRTMNDFGTQGEPPTHPELLDWLAATFRDSGWDVKALLRLIVTSRTYHQESRWRSNAPVDRGNHLLARGPSFRMSAEMIRDQSLAVAGLLCRQIGGPSVKPYQPPGLWEEVSYNAAETYVPDTGDGLWRRSLYTYIKRQSPPPTFLAFDGTTREKCTIQRPRTSTPLQSLILLNDSTFVDAARAVATQVLGVESEDSERLRQLVRRVLSRLPDNDELGALNGLLQRQRQRFSKTPEAARALVAIGAAKTESRSGQNELAAWTVVAQTVLNLDEAIHPR